MSRIFAAVDTAVATLLRRRLGAIALPAVAALFVAALLTAWTEAPSLPLAGPDPADPGARAPRVDYRSTIGAYKSQRPVEPAPWGEQNQRVAPQPKSGR